MIKLTAARRDFIFLILLIVMVRIAFNSQKAAHTTPTLYAAADQHADSFRLASSDPFDSSDISLSLADDQPFFHPPDKHVLHHISTLADQLNSLIAALPTPSQELVELKGIRERLLYLKRKYQHTSPALALLGPIGSTGIVLKEQRLEQELLKNAQRIGVILMQLINDDEQLEMADTLSAMIERNQQLLAKLSKEESIPGS